MIKRPFSIHILISTGEEIDVESVNCFILQITKIQTQEHMIQKFSYSARSGHPMDNFIWSANRFYKVYETYENLKYICLEKAVKCYARLQEQNQFLVRYFEETVAPFQRFRGHVHVESQQELDELMVQNEKIVFSF
jgi:hypothetical protein